MVLVKYVLIVLRADDNGEGGTFALYSRLCRSMGLSPFGTLQAKEHEQLVTISRRPPPAPVTSRIGTLRWAGGQGRAHDDAMSCVLVFTFAPFGLRAAAVRNSLPPRVRCSSRAAAR